MVWSRIHPIVYAEVSVRFTRIEDLELALPPSVFARGARQAPLPDFYIGAHAAVSRLRLLTRDARR